MPPRCPSLLKKAVKGEDITVYGDGTQTRDFIYVKDIVGALTFVAEHPGVTGVFNAGYGGQITIEELADNIIKAAGSSSKVLHAPERAGDVKAFPRLVPTSSAMPAGARIYAAGGACHHP